MQVRRDGMRKIESRCRSGVVSWEGRRTGVWWWKRASEGWERARLKPRWWGKSQRAMPSSLIAEGLPAWYGGAVCGFWAVRLSLLSDHLTPKCPALRCCTPYLWWNGGPWTAGSGTFRPQEPASLTPPSSLGLILEGTFSRVSMRASHTHRPR